MNKREQLNKKFQRQQEIVNNAKAAHRDVTADENAEFWALQRDIDTLRAEIEAEVRTETEAGTQEERQRASEINALCRDFGIDPTEYITSGATVDQVRAVILEKSKGKRNTPTITITGDETDKFREAAIDALLFRGGINVQDPAAGYKDLVGMRLTGLASECVLRKGIHSPQRLDEDTLLREALTPDSQFTGILSNAASKAMAVSYRAASTTFQRWTRKGSNLDFKATTHYQISEAGDLIKMPQFSEFKFDAMTDVGVRKSLATFGRAWAFSRQAIINDDIGALTKVPAAYARAAARGINKLVYMQLGENAVIYDGKQLFHVDHANLAAAGGVINLENVNAGKAAMRKQKGLRGTETLKIEPGFLLVPTALETSALQFVSRKFVPNTFQDVNPIAEKIQPVVDAELDAYSTTAWYLAADPMQADTIEVTYLRENDLPTIESEVSFDYLGVKWRIYIDYGVTVLDYRGLYNSPNI